MLSHVVLEVVGSRRWAPAHAGEVVFVEDPFMVEVDVVGCAGVQGSF